MRDLKKPWKACLNVPTATIPGHIIKVDDDVQLPIASIYEGGGTHGKKFYIAVAHLISAAPELLQALRGSHRALYYVRDDARTQALQIRQQLIGVGNKKKILSLTESAERWDAIAEELEADIKTALAVIAKAEGKVRKTSKKKGKA